MTRPPLGLVVVVGLLAVGTTVTSVIGTPAQRRARAESVEVIGATAVCPELSQVPGVLATRVSVGSAPLPPGRQAGVGQIESLPVIGATQATVLPIAQPGQVAVGLGAGLDHNALVVTASGSLAAGLEVEQVTRGEQGPLRGLAGLRCDAPRPEAWFVGGATSLGDTSVLVLANAEDTPSTVDVTVFSKQGAVDPRPGQGLTVAPHSRLVVSMDTLAPDRSILAVHVLSRSGRVAAALRHFYVANGVPQGIDWVPQTVPPAQHVVVPGFPQGPGRRYLLLANPTSDDTTVSVTVTTNDGQFVPSGLDAVSVPAGHCTAVALTDVAATGPLSAAVTSTGSPVLAGGLVDDTQGGAIREFAYTAGTPALSGPALLTDLVIDRPTESTLLLTAPEDAGSVVVTPIQVLGAVGALPAPRTITVPAGRTVAFRLSTFFPPGTSTRLAVEVRPVPGSGVLYAARYLRAHGAHGPLTTILDLQGPARLVVRPRVDQDPQAGYVGG